MSSLEFASATKIKKSNKIWNFFSLKLLKEKLPTKKIA
jgi:hypothetical protein